MYALRKMYSLVGAAVLCFLVDGATPVAVDAADKVLFIQPIQVCDDAGGNCSNSGQELYEAAQDKIFAQANVDLKFLPWATLDANAFRRIDSAAEFNMLLDGMGHSQHAISSVYNLWFVEHVYDEGDDGVLGRGRLGGNGSVIADSVFAASDLGTIAHELGHNLGLDHETFGAGGADNLMTAGDVATHVHSINNIFPDGERLAQLNPQQIEKIRSSSNLKPFIQSTWNAPIGAQFNWSVNSNWTNNPEVEVYPHNDPAQGVFTVDTHRGSIYLDRNVEVDGYTQEGGMLSTILGFDQGPAANLSVVGSLKWTGGRMIGAGTTIAQGPLEIITPDGGQMPELRARTLEAQHEVTIRGGGLVASNGATVRFGSLAEVTVPDDSDLLSFDGNAVLVNGGLLNKRGGNAADETSIDWKVENTGIINIFAGNLRLARGGGGNGGYFVERGSKLTFTGDFEIGDGTDPQVGTINGDGEVIFHQGTSTLKGDFNLGMEGRTILEGETQVTFEQPSAKVGGELVLKVDDPSTNVAIFQGPLTVPKLSIVGIAGRYPTLEVRGDMTIDNSFDWRGGMLAGVGNTVTKGAVSIKDIVSLTARTITNRNAITLQAGPITQGAHMIGENNARVVNEAGASFVLKDDADLVLFEGSQATLENAGEIVKTAGVGESEIAWQVKNAGKILNETGTLKFLGAFTQSAGEISVADGATIAFAQELVVEGGNLTGKGIIEAPRVKNLSVVRPGASAGVLTIDGDYQQIDFGVLSIELAGTEGGEFDQLAVMGSADLAGLLTVSLLDNFRPAHADQFTILTADSVAGRFLNAAEQVAVGAGRFNVLYRPDAVILTNFQIVPEIASLTMVCVFCVMGQALTGRMRWRCS